MTSWVLVWYAWWSREQVQPVIVHEYGELGLVLDQRKIPRRNIPPSVLFLEIHWTGKASAPAMLGSKMDHYLSWLMAARTTEKSWRAVPLREEWCLVSVSWIKKLSDQTSIKLEDWLLCMLTGLSVDERKKKWNSRNIVWSRAVLGGLTEEMKGVPSSVAACQPAYPWLAACWRGTSAFKIYGRSTDEEEIPQRQNWVCGTLTSQKAGPGAEKFLQQILWKFNFPKTEIHRRSRKPELLGFFIYTHNYRWDCFSLFFKYHCWFQCQFQRRQWVQSFSFKVLCNPLHAFLVCKFFSW